MKITCNEIDNDLTKTASNSEQASEAEETKETPTVTHEDNLELRGLPFKERMRAKRARLIKNMEGMSKSEKVSYILSYYKWSIIITIIFIACAIIIPTTIYKNTRPVAIAYAIVNCKDPANINTAFVDDYRDYFDLTGSYNVHSETELQLDLETFRTEYAMSSTASVYTQFPMMCYNGYYDIIITDAAGAEYCSKQEVFTQLDYYLPTEIYSQIKDRVYEAENYDGIVVPYAIDISDTEFAKNLNLGYEDVYLGFPGTTDENYKNAKRMLIYILGIDIEEL